MSLAELLSDSKGLSNFSGNASTCIRNYSIKEAAATGTVDGGVLPQADRGFANKNLQVTSGDHLNLLNASATGSVMGAEIVSKVSFLVNDNRSTVGFAEPPRDEMNIKLYEGSVKASGSLGAVEWGKSLSLFGSSAKACDVTPGAGFTANEPAMQFKFTLPELTPGLKVDLALANLPRDNVSHIVPSRIDLDAEVHNVTSTRNLGLEGKVSYDTGYGAVLNLEFLNNKANGFITAVAVDAGNAHSITALTAGNSDKIKGLAGSIDVDMSGFTGCLGTAKTEGLGHLHPAVGGFIATTGAKKYKHTFGKVGYAMDASVVSVPLKFDINYGKTEQDGSKNGTLVQTTLFKENTRTGFCIGTPLSEDLTFDLCYDQYKTKNSVGAANKMNVTSICGLYKF